MQRESKDAGEKPSSGADRSFAYSCRIGRSWDPTLAQWLVCVYRDDVSDESAEVSK